LNDRGVVKLSTVLSALSYALDLTEGHPRGHAARSALIGMRVARTLELSAAERSDLFYALLLKDTGCSSNAARVHQLFGGDDHSAKRAVWEDDWRKLRSQLRYVFKYVQPGAGVVARALGFWRVATSPKARREIFEVRCDRGADIARAIGMSERTAQAVRSMDEHWDGGGLPDGLRGEDIPLLARVVGIAQVIEIYWGLGGRSAAREVARDRSGRWFDPQLVRAFLAINDDDPLWRDLDSPDLEQSIAAAEPEERVIPADEERLDRIAHAFALVVDAKSSFTFEHSERVASIAATIGGRLGLSDQERRRLRYGGLLHDIGKLSVPNRILDKPAALTGDEWVVVKQHPHFSYEILSRVPVFSELAFDASAHHERLNGSGYFRGLTGESLSVHARILATADVFDALSAQRPYRAAMPLGEVLSVLRAKAGTELCPDAVGAVCDSPEITAAS
jgi:HD-GYP domain-containing protein (c-di-GMP phosphodiesterase class II)